MDEERLNLLHDSLGESALLAFLSEAETLFARCVDELLNCVHQERQADVCALAHLRCGQAVTLGCTELAQALQGLERLALQPGVPAAALIDQLDAIAPIATEAVAALRSFMKRLGA